MYSNIPSFYTLFKEYIDYLFQFFILINYILNRRESYYTELLKCKIE